MHSLARRLLTLVTACVLSAQDDLDLRKAAQLMTAGKISEAISIYAGLSRKYPEDAGLLVNLAIAHYKSGNYRQTVDHAQRALKLRPELPAASLLLGAGHLGLNQPQLARGPLETAVRKLPADRNARLMLAETELLLGRAGEAASLFEPLTAQLPREPRVWYGLGRSLQALGRRDAAMEAFARLKQLPPSAQSHGIAAEELEERGLHLQASREWIQALQLAPHNLRIRMKTAWALYRARDYPAALEHIEQLKKQQPESAELLFLHGGCFVNMAQPEKAIPLLQSAFGLDPSFLPNRAALGQALLQTGNAAGAIPHLEAAISTDTDGSIRYQLSRARKLARAQE